MMMMMMACVTRHSKLKMMTITLQEPQTQPQSKSKQKEDKKKGDKSIQEKYPLNPDYLNQIVVLGKEPLTLSAQLIILEMRAVSTTR